MVEAPLISVRRPGIVLDKGWTILNATNLAGEVQRSLPVLLPGHPSLEP